jgi:DNA-binding NarL/FixJ family response regulator
MASKESKVNPRVFNQRERVILNLIAEGYENREIADELSISERAVMENQINLMKKLDVPDMSSVIDHALGKGLISPYEVLESRFSKLKTQVN